MSYNDLNLGDTVVQGHKFAGGGQETLISEHMLNASNALQFTVPYDCLLSIQSAKWLFINLVD